MDETKLGRPLTEIELETLKTLLSVDFPGVVELRAQVPMAACAGTQTAGTPPSFDVTVPKDAPRSSFDGIMAPITADVYNSKEEYIGEFLLWLVDGYLSSVEYAWVTDEPPKHLPDPRSIRVSVEN